MVRFEDIPYGREHAITRGELQGIWHINDRDVRREINRMRLEEHGDCVIVSTSNGRGYYRSDNVEDIEHYINEMRSRISSTVSTIERARMVLGRIRNRKDMGEAMV